MDVIDKLDDRPVEPRSRLWASEIGGSMIDRYLKMKGTVYTNPPNSRSMRKFMAGDIWEWIVQQVLLKAGMLVTTQQKIWFDPSASGDPELAGLLPVSGRIDFLAGGTPDWEKSRQEFEAGMYPDFMKKLALGMIEQLEEKYPLGLEIKGLEIKSCSAFMFERYLATGKPSIHHAMQAYVYAKELPYEFDVVYVCRDDVRLLQFPITRDSVMYEKYLIDDIKQITYYHNNDIQPEKESLMIWDKDFRKFTKNWKVEYSPYLMMLYSYQTKEMEEPKFFERPDEYAEYIEPKVSAWNRVVKRLIEGKEITKANEVYIEEMKSFGFDLRSLLTIK